MAQPTQTDLRELILTVAPFNGTMPDSAKKVVNGWSGIGEHAPANLTGDIQQNLVESWMSALPSTRKTNTRNGTDIVLNTYMSCIPAQIRDSNRNEGINPFFLGCTFNPHLHELESRARADRMAIEASSPYRVSRLRR